MFELRNEVVEGELAFCCGLAGGLGRCDRLGGKRDRTGFEGGVDGVGGELFAFA